MSQYRCESCDVPLTVEQLRIEVGLCPPCRAELTEGRRQVLAAHADALRACTGAVSVTVTDGDITVESKVNQ